MVVILSANTGWNLAHFRAPLLQALAERGFFIVVSAPRDASVSLLQAMGYRYEPISISAHGLKPWAELLIFLGYLRLLLRYRPHALLTFTVKPNIYAGLAARLLGVTHLGNISGLGSSFIQGGWLGWLVQMFYRLGLGSSKTVFFQNPDDRKLFLEKGIVRPNQAEVLPGSGVDLRHFSPVTTQVREIDPPFDAKSPFIFLFIGRLLADKGLMELVQAIRLVNEVGTERSSRVSPEVAFKRRAKLLILGPEGGSNPASISRALLAEWRQNPELEFLGSTKDVRPFIDRADCVVLPSYREGTPRSLLEAAAMGKPLIASDVPGCREIVHDCKNGYLCRVKDPEDLALAMRRLMQLAATQRQDMGKASRRLAEEVFDEKFVVEKYLQALGIK
jgi:glycosyltransferase involved in cell wall biosynthesis